MCSIIDFINFFLELRDHVIHAGVSAFNKEALDEVCNQVYHKV